MLLSLQSASGKLLMRENAAQKEAPKSGSPKRSVKNVDREVALCSSGKHLAEGQFLASPSPKQKQKCKRRPQSCP